MLHPFRRIPAGGVDNTSITGYFCSCKCGLRTIGCCVHIMSAIMYLSHLRYCGEIISPSKKLNQLFDSAEIILNDDSEEE